MPRRHTHQKHVPFFYESSCQGKRRFASQRAAEEAVERLQLERPNVELSVYHCPRCLGWHLTSKKTDTL